MMHFFEPEVESRWPFSASWDSRVSGILNDASSCGFPAGNTEIQQSPGSNDPFPRLDILLNGEYFTGSSDSLGCIPAVMSSDQIGSRIMSGSGNKQTPDHVMEHTKMRDATLMEEEIAPRDARKQKAAVVPCTKKPQQLSKKARFTTLEMEKNVKIPSKRNQKLGDKITALQQLVSPFGKTDTASVLQEATIYIKDLLEQIQTLTSPYCEMEFSTKLQQHQQQKHGGETLGLHKRGLCLVPVSDSIINLTNQAPNDAHTDERMTRRVGVYAPWS